MPLNPKKPLLAATNIMSNIGENEYKLYNLINFLKIAII